MVKISNQLQKKIEKRSLIIGSIINLVMAFAGWVAYSFSGSEALLLDGNFSFISFISVLIAIWISSIKDKRTTMFPYGLFVYESLYTFLKGVMIMGVVIAAITQNTAKIIKYFNGKAIAPIDHSTILFYTITVTTLCFALAYSFKIHNKAISNSSNILNTDYKSSVIDGIISASIGIALIATSFIPLESKLGFLNYIGDSIIVIVMAILIAKQPLSLIKNSFIEIAGGTLQNTTQKKKIEGILKSYLDKDCLLNNSFVSQTGSNYLVIAYINLGNLQNNKQIELIRENISSDLNKEFSSISLEFIIAK